MEWSQFQWVHKIVSAKPLVNVVGKERANFLLVGFSAVGIDLSVYYLLFNMMAIGINISKIAGFLSGAIFAYFANRYFTFSHSGAMAPSMVRFILLYAATLALNIYSNNQMFHWLLNFDYHLIISFLFATSLSTVANYIGMKFYVFRKN